jgi:four helix bundle protein
MFKFEKLEVWKESIALSREVYRISRNLPADERFGLTSQVRRAAVSIAANIAEGSGRTSRKDFLRFVEMAYGSLMESISHLAIAQQESFIDGAIPILVCT